MKDLFVLSVNGTPIPAPTGIPTGPEFTIGSIASAFLHVAAIAGILLSTGYLVYGAFLWLQSSGDKQKLDKARRTIIYSLFGLIIMSLAAVIVNVFGSAFGIKTAVNP